MMTESCFASHGPRAAEVRSPRTAWGSWRYNPELLQIFFDRPGPGPWQDCIIGLEYTSGPVDMLNRVMEVSCKPWATSEVVGDLVAAMVDLLGPSVAMAGPNAGSRAGDVRAILGQRGYEVPRREGNRPGQSGPGPTQVRDASIRSRER